MRNRLGQVMKAYIHQVAHSAITIRSAPWMPLLVTLPPTHVDERRLVRKRGRFGVASQIE